MTGPPTTSAISVALIGTNERHITSPFTMPYNPSTCLFCNHASADLSSSLDHMSHSHSFFIPNQDYLIDLPTFLSFLNTVISEFHECLFCGTERSNKWAVQDHMKSKGHCRIDIEEEEWADFWYISDAGNAAGNEDGDAEAEDTEGQQQEDPASASERLGKDDGICLPSGKTLGHRSQARYFRRNPNRRALPTPSPRQIQHNTATSKDPESQAQSSVSESSDRQLVMRAGTSTSLIGIPELQVTALRQIEKKAMQVETRARNRHQAVLERAGNSQKHFKPDVPGPKNG